jgi:hypothetical protein
MSENYSNNNNKHLLFEEAVDLSLETQAIPMIVFILFISYAFIICLKRKFEDMHGENVEKEPVVLCSCV